MIDKLADFMFVRGKDRTGHYFGDLERIKFPHPLMVRRFDAMPMGIDIAWLQECVAERNHLLGIPNYDEILTFDMFLYEHHIVAISKAANSYLEGKNFINTTAIADGGDVIDISGDDYRVFPTLHDVVKAKEGLCITEPPRPLQQTHSEEAYSTLNKFLVFALEELMPWLSILVIDLKIKGLFQEEELSGDYGNEYGIEDRPGQIVGGRDIYAESAISRCVDGERKEFHFVRTASLGSLDSLSVYESPCFYNSVTPIAQKYHVWVPVIVSYVSSGPIKSELHRLFVKTHISTIRPGGINRTDIQKILNTVEKLYSFDMSPGSFPHQNTDSYEYARLLVSLGSQVGVVCEMKDSVVYLE